MHFFVRTSDRPSKPAFGTYGFIFCMKTVGKLIEWVLRGKEKGYYGFMYAPKQICISKIAHKIPKSCVCYSSYTPWWILFILTHSDQWNLRCYKFYMSYGTLSVYFKIHHYQHSIRWCVFMWENLKWILYLIA